MEQLERAVITTAGTLGSAYNVIATQDEVITQGITNKVNDLILRSVLILIAALLIIIIIVATSANKGVLIPATEIDYKVSDVVYSFNGGIYENRVKSKALKPASEEELVFGPNIKDWPAMI